MEDEYQGAVKKFYEIYRPLQKRYNLRSHMRFSIYNEGLIEIWECVGEARRDCVIRIKEEGALDCYKKAIEELQYYKKKKEQMGDEGNAAMAV